MKEIFLLFEDLMASQNLYKDWMLEISEKTILLI